LKVYEDREFHDRDEILEEAAKNKQEAVKQKKNVGGILYNPLPEQDDGIYSSIFNTRNNKPQQTAA